MTCEQLSDRMPAVARRELSWTGEEEAHLAECPDCRAEWELVSVTVGLGANVVGDLDVHHVTQRVLGRLRDERRMRGRQLAWTATGLAAAAAVALTVWAGSPGLRLPHVPAVRPTAEVAQLPVPGLDSLATPELEAVLHSLDTPIGTTVEPSDTTTYLDSLDAPELQQVLDTLEG
jgi:hypothetical protein